MSLMRKILYYEKDFVFSPVIFVIIITTIVIFFVWFIITFVIIITNIDHCGAQCNSLMNTQVTSTLGWQLTIYDYVSFIVV